MLHREFSIVCDYCDYKQILPDKLKGNGDYKYAYQKISDAKLRALGWKRLAYDSVNKLDVCPLCKCSIVSIGRYIHVDVRGLFSIEILKEGILKVWHHRRKSQMYECTFIPKNSANEFLVKYKDATKSKEVEARPYKYGKEKENDNASN